MFCICFDEPTIERHPLDMRILLEVFQTLMEHGATVIVIEHDLDVIRNSDYVIDMGPGGGKESGRIVATGTLGYCKKQGKHYWKIPVKIKNVIFFKKDFTFCRILDILCLLLRNVF